MTVTVTVSINADDITFILESIGQNVASDDEKTPEQLKTTNKLRRVENKLHDKGAWK